MIARLAIPIILAILLTWYYLDRYYWRKMKPRWKRWLLWLFPVAAIWATGLHAMEKDYFPDNIYHLFYFLDAFCVQIVPAITFTLCAFIGRMLKRVKAGECVGGVVATAIALSWLWGTLVGFRQFEVVRVEYASTDLPEAFDGYRIVQFSDAHVGTLIGNRESILRRAIDSINAQGADLVVFAGDLQNKRAEEIERQRELLSTIHAKDGVYAVMGNHDYAEYLDVRPAEKPYYCQRTADAIKSLGWHLLTNSHAVVRRDSSEIIIAGMENDGEGRFPQLGDVLQTLRGVSYDAFIVMIEHDPTSWRRKILPQCHAQLTLSGHTHDGQMSLFGWSPAQLIYRECHGFYSEGDRALYVSKGLGGVVPFRLGNKGEIVVITLKSKKR